MGIGAFSHISLHQRGNQLVLLVELVLMGLRWVEEAKSMEEVGPLMEWGSLWEVEESLTVEDMG